MWDEVAVGRVDGDVEPAVQAKLSSEQQAHELDYQERGLDGRLDQAISIEVTHCTDSGLHAIGCHSLSCKHNSQLK